MVSQCEQIRVAVASAEQADELIVGVNVGLGLRRARVEDVGSSGGSLEEKQMSEKKRAQTGINKNYLSFFITFFLKQ